MVGETAWISPLESPILSPVSTPGPTLGAELEVARRGRSRRGSLSLHWLSLQTVDGPHTESGVCVPGNLGRLLFSGMT